MTSTTSTPAAQRSRVLPRRVAAVGGAVAAGLLVWLVSVPALGVELTARSGGGEIVVGPAPVVLAGLVAGLGGWGLLALLERFTGRPRLIWTGVAVTVLALSLIAPLVQATTVAAATVLIAMHVAVGAVVLVGLGPTAGKGAGRPERPMSSRATDGP